MIERPYYLAGRPEAPNHDLLVRDKASGEVYAKVAQADDATLDRAIAAAVAAGPAMKALPAYVRQQILEHCVRRFSERAEELALGLCREAGKPIKDARGEVTRLVDTFRHAAGEAVRIPGEVLDLASTPRAKGYRGFVQRVPIGPVALISPFNFPLNLVAHKVAPAIAAGCPFVLKPASSTPLGALIIAEILAETELPAGAFSVLPCPGAQAARLAEDPRLKLLSFTGSPEVGWALKARAGQKKVLLELGGNAAVVVEPDWDLDDVVRRIVFGAYYQSGQSCISVQRILAHHSIYEGLSRRLAEATAVLKVGDPQEEDTFIGPLISEGDALRLEHWIEGAKRAGAKVLAGGRRRGPFLEATLLADVPKDQPLVTEEAFGPVAVISPYSTFEDALAEVNDSRFGLQAGVFTRDLYRAQAAWDQLEVGGVVIGDVPSWRVDPMPYGGVKGSGLGREGLRYTIEEFTEPRLMVVRTPS